MHGNKTSTDFQDIAVVVDPIVEACNQVKENQLVATLDANWVGRAAENIRVRGTTHTLDSVIPVQDSRVGRCGQGSQEDREVEIDIHAEGIVGEGEPIVAQLTLGAVDSRTVNHNVIAAFHIHVVVTRPGDHDVMTLGQGLACFCRSTIITLEEVLTTTGVLHPVVTGAASLMSEEDAVEQVIVARPTEHLTELTDIDQEVVAVVAEEKVPFVATIDVVVTLTTKERVRTRQVRNYIIAKTALNEVATVATFDAVIATPAPERIITNAANDGVVSFGAADRDVITTGVHNDSRLIGNKEIGRETVRVANDQGDQN